MRFLPPDGAERAYQLHGGAGHVLLDPRWHQAAWAFVKFGFFHILEGVDHLLFLLCLIVPFRRLSWTLVGVVTSFTVAHSITLIAAAYGLVPRGAWFPPLVETLIAASIVYMAIENIARPNLRWRWIVAGLFGLVHGFAFSFLCRTSSSSPAPICCCRCSPSTSASSWGRSCARVAIPLLSLLFAEIRLSERLVHRGDLAFVAHAAWHWLVERWDALAKVEWP